MATKPCPRCQAPLEIPQPLPEQIDCLQCGAVLKSRAVNKVEGTKPGSPSSAVPAAAAKSLPSAKSRIWLVLGLGGGALLLGGVLVVTLSLAWVFGRAKAPPTPPPASTPEEKAIDPPELTDHEKKVNLAIDRGAVYLKKRLAEDKTPITAVGIPWADTHIGATALMGLALLETGTPPDDPVIRDVLAVVHKNQGRLSTVYSLGTVLFFLNRLNNVGALEEEGEQLIHHLALRLIAGQNPSGQWSYRNPPLSPQEEELLLAKLENGKYEAVGGVAVYGSNSMTQFAMLSLWGTRKCGERRRGIPVQAPLLKAAAHFRKSQNPDGSWGYRGATGPFDANTCAGLLALAIEEGLLADPEIANKTSPAENRNADVAEMRRKGFAWLGQVIGQDPKKPSHPYTGYPGMGKMIGASANGDCYFLWSFERMAVVHPERSLIAGKDWYQWGSGVLLDAQKENGAWSDGFDPAIDTSFAILFLKRSNLAKDLTRIRELRRAERDQELDVPPEKGPTIKKSLFN